MKFYIATQSFIVSRADGFFKRRKSATVSLATISVVTESGHSYTAISKEFVKGYTGNLESLLGANYRNRNVFIKDNYRIAAELNQFVLYHASTSGIEWYGFNQCLDKAALMCLAEYGLYIYLHVEYMTDLYQSIVEFIMSLPSKVFLSLPFQAMPAGKITVSEAMDIASSHELFPAPIPEDEKSVTTDALRIGRTHKFLEELKNEVLLLEVN